MMRTTTRFHNDSRCRDFANEPVKLGAAQFLLPKRFAHFIDSMCLKHALSNIDPIRCKSAIFVPPVFALIMALRLPL